MEAHAIIPYGRQCVDESDIDAVVRTLRSPWITQGPQAAAFEGELALCTGARYATVCANGTAALHLAYRALGVGRGDEIITTPITFAATASAALSLGARVVLADVEPDTGNIDPRSAASLVGPRTQGIVAVHLGGLPAELRALRDLCDRRGLWMVEDASHALGARYRGTAIGSCAYSDATTFSFHPVKHVTTGEGGAVMVRDGVLQQRLQRLRSHGIERDPSRFEGINAGPWCYEVQELGYNYRLSDLQCALGRSQLRKQPGWLERRREIALRYRRWFRMLPGVSVQAARVERESAWHLLIALIDFAGLGVERAEVMRRLQEAGIGSQVHYIPLHHHPYFRGIQRDGGLTGAETFYARALSLPMFPGLTDDQVDWVAQSLGRALGVQLALQEVRP